MGAYFKWLTYPEGSKVTLLEITKISGNGHSAQMTLTRYEAEALYRFIDNS